MDGPRAPVSALAFTTGGRLVAGSADRRASVWDAASGTAVRAFPAALSRVVDLALIGDDLVLVCSERHPAQLIDLGDGTVRASLTGHVGPAITVAVGPDRRSWVTGGRDTTAITWSLPDDE